MQGVVVVDVVEGTAMASLPHMTSVLRARPRSFTTLNAAIQWSLRSGMCHNPEAACISVPAMLTQQSGAPIDEAVVGGLSSLAEEQDDAQGTVQPAEAGQEVAPESSRPWVWRTPLERSAVYWEGWYSGLSTAFLQLPQPKVLIVAGTDRMDKTLMIGQMQGKFQFVLLPQVACGLCMHMYGQRNVLQAGHAVHEDEAGRTADVLLEFLARFRIGMPAMAVPRAPPGVARVLPVVTGPPAR